MNAMPSGDAIVAIVVVMMVAIRDGRSPERHAHVPVRGREGMPVHPGSVTVGAHLFRRSHVSTVAARATTTMHCVWWASSEDGIDVFVRAVPGAATSMVMDASGDRLRIRVAARAVEGKANHELCRFLASACDVRRSAVSITRGERSRDKTIRIAGIAAPPARLGDHGK